MSIDVSRRGDYNGSMIVNLRESKARLSELVELACRGEDVLITVRGKIRARLSRASEAEQLDMASWAEELESLQKLSLKPNRLTVEQILDSDRQERAL